jgi:hypothetical protein
MSFQKAHSISNELAEVVAQSEEATLNGISGNTIELELFQPIFKSYRVLEVGLVITDTTASTATANAFTVGLNGATTAFVSNQVDLPALSAVGQRFSTSVPGGSTDFSFRLTGGNIDSTGTPILNVGEKIIIRGTANTSGATKGVFYARLAPELDREV